MYQLTECHQDVGDLIASLDAFITILSWQGLSPRSVGLEDKNKFSIKSWQVFYLVRVSLDEFMLHFK